MPFLSLYLHAVHDTQGKPIKQKNIILMIIKDIHLVYFSATYTTRKVLRGIAHTIEGNIVEHDVTDALPFGNITIGADSLLIIGAPVYAGRLPRRAAEAFKMLRGSSTPAIAVCVYGNRDYDDALVELQDIIEERGFKTVAAGAFIGRHCIFPTVAGGRPDDADMLKADDFARKSLNLLRQTDDISQLPRLTVKGNRPYKQGGASTFTPVGDVSKCDGCMTCMGKCPMEAIPADAPCTTDADRCIACGRCVVVCPQGARGFGGEAYKGFEAKFTAAFSQRREPETFFAG